MNVGAHDAGAREGVEKTSGSNLRGYDNWIHSRKDSIAKHLNLLSDARKSQPAMEEKNATRIRKRNLENKKQITKTSIAPKKKHKRRKASGWDSASQRKI